MNSGSFSESKGGVLSKFMGMERTSFIWPLSFAKTQITNCKMNIITRCLLAHEELGVCLADLP